MFLSLLFVFCTTNKKDPFQLKAKDFQTTIGGKKTDLFLLQNKETKVYITNYGGRIVSLLTPDKNGDMGDVVLGSQNDVNKAAKEPQTFFRFKERYGMGLQLLRQVEMCKIIETKTKIVLRKQCIVLGIFEGF